MDMEKVRSIWMTCNVEDTKGHCFNVHIMDWGFMTVDALMMLESCVTLVNNIISFLFWIFNLWISDSNCEDGDVRLADGNATVGRVEICLTGVWGVVCDNNWDVRDARVTCRKLGLPFKCELSLSTV